MYKSIAEIKRKNEAINNYFFEKDALLFFDCIIEPEVYQTEKGTMFITSEQYDQNTPRLYTVRRATEEGIIETYSVFQQFNSKAQAVEYIKKEI